MLWTDSASNRQMGFEFKIGTKRSTEIVEATSDMMQSRQFKMHSLQFKVLEPFHSNSTTTSQTAWYNWCIWRTLLNMDSCQPT